MTAQEAIWKWPI